MSTVPYERHDRHAMATSLRVGNTTPRSTSPRASQIDLPLINPENYPERLSVIGAPMLSRCSSNSETVPPSEETILPNDAIVPIAPYDVEKLKYHRFEYYSMNPDDAQVPKIEPLERDYEREGVPSQWQTYVCPEGKLYFAHRTKKVVTLTDVQIPDYHKRLEVAIRRLEETIEQSYPQLSTNATNDVEIVVHCTWKDGTPVIGYYMADWGKQVVFWLDQVDHNMVTNGDRPPVSKPHLLLATRAQFGQHVEIFCAHHPLPQAMVDEVQDSFNSGSVDVITSEDSMFSYDVDTNNHLLRSIDRVKAGGIIHAHSAWIIGRLYKTLHRDRFLAFYGESGARCGRRDGALAQSDPSPRSLFFFIMSPVLFFMPFVYLKELDAVFVDKTVHYHAWRRFIDVLRRDWDNAITPATVLLSANVGFLAIQSIDTDGGDKSMAQISSYVSAILSLFIYIVCQILTRRHRHHKEEQAERALAYLTTREERLLGLQTVAMAFSLPIALFIWSMLTFLGAMVFIFFDKTNLATKIALGSILAVLIFLIVVLLYMEWDTDWTPTSGLDIFWKELVSNLRAKIRKQPIYFRRNSNRKHSATDDDSTVGANRSEMSINVETASATDVGSATPRSSVAEKRRSWTQSLGRLLTRTSTRSSVQPMVAA